MPRPASLRGPMAAAFHRGLAGQGVPPRVRSTGALRRSHPLSPPYRRADRYRFSTPALRARRTRRRCRDREGSRLSYLCRPLARVSRAAPGAPYFCSRLRARTPADRRLGALPASRHRRAIDRIPRSQAPDTRARGGRLAQVACASAYSLRSIRASALLEIVRHGVSCAIEALVAACEVPSRLSRTMLRAHAPRPRGGGRRSVSPRRRQHLPFAAMAVYVPSPSPSASMSRPLVREDLALVIVWADARPADPDSGWGRGLPTLRDRRIGRGSAHLEDLQRAAAAGAAA